jgi:hypothetical protein
MESVKEAARKGGGTMEKIRVFLAGGPNDLADSARLHHVENLDDTVKLSDSAGYEHFVHTGDYHRLENEDVPLFRWIRRTRVAE